MQKVASLRSDGGGNFDRNRGIINVFPGAVHTIPGAAEFYVDIRGVRAEDKQRLVTDFRNTMPACSC